MSSTETLQIKNYIGLTGDKPIRFIASDVDGTLVNDAKAIPDEAIEAIRAARESGIRVAIASGRAWNEMNDVIEKLPCLRYFMCTNGAYVMGLCACLDERKEGNDSDAKSSHSVMDNHIPADTEGHLPGETHDHYALAEGDEAANINMSECEVEQSNFFFRPNIRPFILATRTMVPDLLAHMEALDEGPEKMQIFYGDEPMRQRILQDLRDEYQGMSHDGTGRERFYDVLLSSEGNLEFVLPHTTKGTAVEALANHWGFSPDEVMTLGDSENDLSMLRFAGAGVAMGNGKPNIKEAARYVTTDNNHQGAAKAIYSAIAYNNELLKNQ